MSGKKTPLDAGFVARAAAGLRFAFTGKGDWFGAGDAPTPAAQEESKGRQFDYDFAFNTGHSKPRQGEAVDFNQLRSLADNYDVLRLVIEKRKDQVERLNWTIQKRDIASTKEKESQRKDSKVDAAIEFFRRPDKNHSWGDWLRILLEDLFVIDAPCIYPRKTLGGDLYALEPMDGATIKRVLDNTGRTPLPPETAYQQVLKGVAAANYTIDELIYRPRNNRSYKVYGYSPVEQIIMTVNIALRRQVHALEYYKSGSVPDALVGVPETWQAEDIKRFQEYWDLLLSGETAERRKMRFVPGELARNFKETKQPPLKDMYDEWLARVVCFCFSIEPTPFVAQVNRSVAETSREQSISDGLEPIKNWVKGVIDDVLARFMDMGKYEFVWVEDTVQDPRQQAEVYEIYARAGIMTVNEIRAEMGRDPLAEDEMKPAAPPTNEALPDEQQPKEQEAEKLGKSKRPMSEQDLAALIEAFLLGQAENMAAQVAVLLDGVPVDYAAADMAAEAARVAAIVSDGLDFSDWAALVDGAETAIYQAAVAAGDAALVQVMAGNAPPLMQTAIRSRAAKWADARAAEMVGMSRVGGKLVQNPLAKWQITEGTRGMIRQAVQSALIDGDSAQELAGRLKESHAFTAARAKTIARTEIARADGMGLLIGWDETGLVEGKEWLTAEDDKVSEICQENGHAGVIGLHDRFPSGDLMPPAHPNCRCTVLPVIKQE